jgi:hypothetical protein
MADIKKRNLTDIEKFQAMSWHQQTQTILGELVNLTAGVAQHNRALFNLHKAAAIADAIISAHGAAAKTLEMYGWPWGAVLAAVAYAAGLARVAAIAGTSFQGGGAGAAPSLAGATAATPMTPVTAGGKPVTQTQQDQPRPPANVTIVLTGHSFSRGQVEELMAQVEELGKDGFPLRFSVKAS